ncbi:hypothetical protein AALO_G00085090 [Alosa alosa]|uniref:Uncharacterized protein n=1 Tax=Alosa alosa TaxID=278164 RepID=A0AAV6H288_9TELE|nr:hypothetical protein AALO_G00085090 [Alosa alosa]
MIKGVNGSVGLKPSRSCPLSHLVSNLRVTKARMPSNTVRSLRPRNAPRMVATLPPRHGPPALTQPTVSPLTSGPAGHPAATAPRSSATRRSARIAGQAPRTTRQPRPTVIAPLETNSPSQAAQTRHPKSRVGGANRSRPPPLRLYETVGPSSRKGTLFKDHEGPRANAPGKATQRTLFGILKSRV